MRRRRKKDRGLKDKREQHGEYHQRDVKLKGDGIMVRGNWEKWRQSDTTGGGG